eukprot:1921410-Amphidinium_carterae.1
MTVEELTRCRLHVRASRLRLTIGVTDDEGLNRHEVRLEADQLLDDLGTIYLAVAPESKVVAKKPAASDRNQQAHPQPHTVQVYAQNIEEQPTLHHRLINVHREMRVAGKQQSTIYVFHHCDNTTVASLVSALAKHLKIASTRIQILLHTPDNQRR